jgi:sporulation protein YlmC with PRC-barrel domain
LAEVEFSANAEVLSEERPYGRSGCVLFDPLKKEVTHIVVRESEPPGRQRILPIHFVEAANARQITAHLSREELRALDLFVETDFILADARLPWVRMWPFVETPPQLIVLEHEKLPAGEVALRRGMPVYANDGLVGSVGELMIDRPGGKITHLVLREGHLWGTKDVSIPVSMIRSTGKAGIGLRLSKAEIEGLPAIPVHRYGRRELPGAGND